MSARGHLMRVKLLPWLVGLLPLAVPLACSGALLTSVSDAGDADDVAEPSDGATAACPAPPNRSPNHGRSAILSGFSCADAGMRSCEILIDECENYMPSISAGELWNGYTCDCAGGTWSCRVTSRGAGLCQDAGFALDGSSTSDTGGAHVDAEPCTPVGFGLGACGDALVYTCAEAGPLPNGCWPVPPYLTPDQTLAYVCCP